MRATTLFGIGLVAQKRLGRGSWVQDSKLRAADAFFDLGLVVDDASERVIARLAERLAVGVGDKP